MKQTLSSAVYSIYMYLFLFFNRNFTYDFVRAKWKQMNWNWKANQPKTDESQITVLQHHSFHALGLFSISAAVIIHLPCLSSEKRVLYTQLFCFPKPSVSRGPREAGATPPRSWREAACLGFDAITSRRCMHLLIQSSLWRNPDHLPRLRFRKTRTYFVWFTPPFRRQPCAEMDLQEEALLKLTRQLTAGSSRKIALFHHLLPDVRSDHH